MVNCPGFRLYPTQCRLTDPTGRPETRPPWSYHSVRGAANVRLWELAVTSVSLEEHRCSG